MKLSSVWAHYAMDRLGNPTDGPEAEWLTGWQVCELLFDLHPVFQGRHDAIAATPYSDAFDDEADLALIRLARDDSFAGWDGISAGGWRVLYERLVYTETCLIAASMQGAGGGRIPAGLSREAKARALLLLHLLGAGRTIDRQLLPRSEPGSLPAFPAALTLRRQ